MSLTPIMAGKAHALVTMQTAMIIVFVLVQFEESCGGFHCFSLFCRAQGNEKAVSHFQFVCQIPKMGCVEIQAGNALGRKRLLAPSLVNQLPLVRS